MSSRRKLTSKTRNDEESTTVSYSTASTFSYIQSILERRRGNHLFHDTSALPIVQEKQARLTHAAAVHSTLPHEKPGLHQSEPRISTRPKRKHTRKATRSTRSSQRRCRSCKSIQPFVWLTLICIASNWIASRILNEILGEEDVDYSEIEVDSNRGTDRIGLTTQLRQNHATSNAQIAAGGGSIALLYNQTNDSSWGGTEKVQVLTKRFTNLRQRLLSLYSEAVPAEPPSNTSLTSHPLYDADSPQFRALHWLANVDKMRLRHYDPDLIERYTLAVLYFSTGGPEVYEDTDLSQKRRGAWRNPTNFLAPTHVCEWKSRIIDGAGRGGGIRRCDRNKTVVEISLYNELSGTIPTEIGRLWNLRSESRHLHLQSYAYYVFSPSRTLLNL